MLQIKTQSMRKKHIFHKNERHYESRTWIEKSEYFIPILIFEVATNYWLREISAKYHYW